MTQNNDDANHFLPIWMKSKQSTLNSGSVITTELKNPKSKIGFAFYVSKLLKQISD